MNGPTLLERLLPPGSSPGLSVATGDMDEIDKPATSVTLFQATQPIYSVCIGAGYRAVGVREGEEMIWFWIGSHADCDQLLSQWRRRP